MRLSRYTDLAAYTARAEPFLAPREAEHCLILGILRTLSGGESFGNQPPYLALVEDDAGHVTQVALATPPHNLALSRVAPGAETDADEIIGLIANDANLAALSLPGVVGPDTLASTFAQRWARLTNCVASIDANERIFKLTAVRPVRPASGAMRRAQESDRPLLRDWLLAFNREALGRDDYSGVDDNISRRLAFKSSGMYLWQTDQGAVSLAGYGGPTAHGIRIGPVYTAPEARGKGFASALVAALSQRLLDEGRQFVFLFTDLANPTSNHIYQEIGYEAVGDVTEYTFLPMS